MKIGFRTPSISRSVKARTTGAVKRSAKKAVNPLYGKKGMGYVNSPKKAVYNKVYNQTSFGISDIGVGIDKKTVRHMPKSERLAKAENTVRIIEDSKKIVKTTKKPDVFFDRLKLLREAGKDLINYEGYISFQHSPSAVYNEIIALEPEITKEFINRYFKAFNDKAATLKTDKGKENQYIKFYNTLEPYFCTMTTENVDLVIKKYNSKVSKELKKPPNCGTPNGQSAF